MGGDRKRVKKLQRKELMKGLDFFFKKMLTSIDPPFSFLMPMRLRSRSSSRCITASTTIFEKNALWLPMSLELSAVAAHFSKTLRISLSIQSYLV